MAQHNRQQNTQNGSLDPINLNLEENTMLFGDIALAWSNVLSDDNKASRNRENKSTQIRIFYDKVISFYEQSIDMDDATYRKKVYPFVVMLKSKVQYAKTRGLVSGTFVQMINQCVNKATTVEKMANFKYFFEAVIGFYPKK